MTDPLEMTETILAQIVFLFPLSNAYFVFPRTCEMRLDCIS